MEYKLEDFIEKIIDNRGRNPEKYYEYEQYPVIDNYLIKNEIYPNMNLVKRYIDKCTYQNFIRGYLEKHDVIMTLVGNGIGNVSLAPNSESTIIQNTIGFRTNKKIMLDEFLYYYFKNNKKKLVNFDRGSSQPSIKKTDILKMEITVPPIKSQRSLIKILLSLDKKVELNNSIISNLEELAQTLFKRWFVDFEFPNENGEPYKSSGGKMFESELGMIPEGWEVKSLSDIANFQNGLAMQRYRPEAKEESLPVLKIKELRQGSTNNDSDRCSIDIRDSVKVFNGDVVFSWSASLLVKLWVGGNAGLNQHLFKVTSEDFPKWFYYMWTKHYLDEFNAIAKDKATTMGHINRSHLNESKVLVPNETKLAEFTSVFKTFISNKIETAMENNSLEQLRDTLLPKLLSGEIELPDNMEVTDHVPVS